MSKAVEVETRLKCGKLQWRVVQSWRRIVSIAGCDCRETRGTLDPVGNATLQWLETRVCHANPGRGSSNTTEPKAICEVSRFRLSRLSCSPLQQLHTSHSLQRYFEHQHTQHEHTQESKLKASRQTTLDASTKRVTVHTPWPTP